MIERESRHLPKKEPLYKVETATEKAEKIPLGDFFEEQNKACLMPLSSICRIVARLGARAVFVVGTLCREEKDRRVPEAKGVLEAPSRSGVYALLRNVTVTHPY